MTHVPKEFGHSYINDLARFERYILKSERHPSWLLHSTKYLGLNTKLINHLIMGP